MIVSDKSMKKGDVVLLVGVAALLAGIGLYFAFAPEATRFVYQPVEITGSSLLALPPRSPDMALAGVEIKQAGFVTVHVSHGGAPGSVVGETGLLQPGSYPNLEVPMTEPMNDVDAYIMLLFVDDGDGVYEIGIDLPVKSNDVVVKQNIPL